MAALLLMCACGSAGEQTAMSARLARDWSARSSSFQAEILSDEQVTEAEYASALNQARSCIEDRGFRTTELRDLPDGIRSDFGVDPGGQGEPAMMRAWDACVIEFSQGVESVFLAQHIRPAEEFPALKGELVACLRENGITGIDERMSDGDIATQLSDQGGSVAAWACRERFLIITGQAGVLSPP